MAPKRNKCYSGLYKRVLRDTAFCRNIQSDFEEEVAEETWEEELINLNANRKAMRDVEFRRMLERDYLLEQKNREEEELIRREEQKNLNQNRKIMRDVEFCRMLEKDYRLEQESMLKSIDVVKEFANTILVHTCNEKCKIRIGPGKCRKIHTAKF